MANKATINIVFTNKGGDLEGLREDLRKQHDYMNNTPWKEMTADGVKDYVWYGCFPEDVLIGMARMFQSFGFAGEVSRDDHWDFDYEVFCPATTIQFGLHHIPIRGWDFSENRAFNPLDGTSVCFEEIDGERCVKILGASMVPMWVISMLEGFQPYEPEPAPLNDDHDDASSDDSGCSGSNRFGGG